jgi:hypothetical protein
MGAAPNSVSPTRAETYHGAHSMGTVFMSALPLQPALSSAAPLSPPSVAHWIHRLLIGIGIEKSLARTLRLGANYGPIATSWRKITRFWRTAAPENKKIPPAMAGGE